jgi:hypothetical protein
LSRRHDLGDRRAAPAAWPDGPASETVNTAGEGAAPVTPPAMILLPLLLHPALCGGPLTLRCVVVNPPATRRILDGLRRATGPPVIDAAGDDRKG